MQYPVVKLDILVKDRYRTQLCLNDDVDLLVFGAVERKRYWQMQVEAERIGSPFDISLALDTEVPQAFEGEGIGRGGSTGVRLRDIPIAEAYDRGLSQ